MLRKLAEFDCCRDCGYGDWLDQPLRKSLRRLYCSEQDKVSELHVCDYADGWLDPDCPLPDKEEI